MDAVIINATVGVTTKGSKTAELKDMVKRTQNPQEQVYTVIPEDTAQLCHQKKV